MRSAEKQSWAAADSMLSPEGNGQLSLPFRLTGSQSKTAFALRHNCERMIAGNSRPKLVEVEYPCGDGTKKTKVWQVENPENLNCVGFLTLTVGEYEAGPVRSEKERRFVQVWDASEASRRINNLHRRVLADLFEKAIVVTERHKNRAIHFHVVGILRGRQDIRTGFNFDAVRSGNYASASDDLRGLWAHLRDVLPRYGFGRAELTPIEKTGEAIACYVSKYIEKNICNRMADDKRKKLVRYIGWEKSQLKPNEFSWGTERATAWRCKARQLARLVDVYEPEQARDTLGSRWAWHITELIRKVSDKPVPFMIWDVPQKEVCRRELSKVAGHFKVKRNHDLQRHSWEMCGLVWERDEMHEFFTTWPDAVEQCYKLNFCQPKKAATPRLGSGPHSGRIYKLRNYGRLRDPWWRRKASKNN